MRNNKIVKTAGRNSTATTAKSKVEIGKDKNIKIKVLDIDFNLETLLNSTPKKSKSKRKYGESSPEESKEDLSLDESNFEPEPAKKKIYIKKTTLYQKNKRKKKSVIDYINN